MQATRPGLLEIFDPVTGGTIFDSRVLGLQQVVTRRVLPQSGTLLVHGRRSGGAPVVALYDLATGKQRWTNETLFQQTEPKKKGLGGLMQGLVRMASEATALGVLQAGPDVIVVLTAGLASVGGIDGLLKLPGVAVTPAGQNRRIYHYDDLRFLGMGPRTGAALRQLVRDLHPELR